MVVMAKLDADSMIARTVARVPSRGELLDERAIDLDAVERILFEAVQAGIDGAEIVQGNTDAHRLEPVQLLGHARIVIDEERLRDLDFQAVGAETELVEALAHDGRQIG